LIDEIHASYEVSVNQACHICSISQSAYYYKAIKRSDDDVIQKQLKQLADQHPRWGFNKMFSKCKQQGHRWNHKRVYRVYCELGLNIRIKPKKRLPRRARVTLMQPLARNMCWSMDFMSDALCCGRRFRTCNVLDDYNREGLLIKASHSLPARRVTALLDQLVIRQGKPEMIRVDNGPEFMSSDFTAWAEQQDILIHYIQPGKPAQNGFIERFNRTYREEVLDMYLFDNLREVNEISGQWLKMYNHERPHESLGHQTPIDFAEARKKNASVKGSAAASRQLALNNSIFNLS
jgi:putative transposase